MIPRKNLVRALRNALSQPGYAWRAFRQRLRSYVSYEFGNGRSAPPETISLFLTYRCNLRCPMCGQWGENGAFRNLSPDEVRDRLSLEELKALVDNVASFRPNLTLFGGEPMLYRGWTDLVEHVKRNGMRCNIVTNGTMLERYAEEVVRLGLDEIILSLDGPGEIHDRMRGMEGTFDQLVSGVKAVQAEKIAGRARAPLINVSCTMFEHNYEHLEEMVQLAEGLGINSVTFHHLLFISQDAYERHDRFFQERFGVACPDWAGFVHRSLPEMDVSRFVEAIERVSKRDSKVDLSFYPNYAVDEVRRYYTEFEFLSDSYPNRCMSLWMTAYILPDGDVRPYHTMNFSPGNIKEARFTEIWNNGKYRDYRRVIRQRKCFPVCPKGCTEFYRY